MKLKIHALQMRIPVPSSSATQWLSYRRGRVGGDGGSIDGGGLLLRLHPFPVSAGATDYDCSTGIYPGGTGFGIVKFMNDVVNDSAFMGMNDNYTATARYDAQKLVYGLVDSFPGFEDSANIEAFYKANEGTIIGGMGQLYGYLNQLSDSSTYIDSAAYASALSTALNYDTNLITSANYDYNEKMVVKAYLTTVAAGKSLTADTPSTTFVTWLAHQCPLAEGNSVYQARGLYAMINPDEVYNDDSLCPTRPEDRMMSAFDTTSAINNDSVLIYNIHLQPNPAKDYTILYYNIASNQQATLEIFDQLGQLLIRKELMGTANSYVISTNPFQDGVYNYRFTLNQHIIKRDKFVVVW